MIFVTVGSDLPFERLLKTVDRWAAETGCKEIFAQIGSSRWTPKHIDCLPFLPPSIFKERFRTADLIVAHAGMGTILSALFYEKPILVMPRRASLGEDRNEHQLATARRMQALGKAHVAFDDAEMLSRLQNLNALVTAPKIGPYAGEDLLNALREFIDCGQQKSAA
ncbi:MAG: Beta,4-galactosyltransferase CpsIVG [Chthoniobacteraceae bacterium]|nr:Beta,4-galactosyltransferase CpsIVG [Chthoniobacteraceae bacterium]